MKKISTSLLFAVTLVLLAFSANKSFANRAAAAEIAYQWVSGSTYNLTYTLYRDCGSATAEPTTINLCYYNTCNTDKGNVTMNKRTPLGSNGQPVQYTCAGSGSTTCGSGTVRGYRKWIYEGQVTLPSKCDSWHFIVSLASRNAGISNYTVPAANPNLFSEATLNNVDAPNSSSPTFGQDLIQYMCAGVKQNYDYSGVDADGDVLTYSLIDPSSAADNQITCTVPPLPTSYAFGGTSPGTSLATNPFPTVSSFNLDAASGRMLFTPDAATGGQQPIMTMLVTKRRGTKVVGSVTRDMQFVVSTGCIPDGVNFVVEPLPTSDNIFVIPPTVGYVVCPNVQFRVCYKIESPDPTVTITNVTDDNLTFSPTASTSTTTAYSGLGTNSVSACMTWTPVEADEGQRYVVVRSQICKAGSPVKYRVDSIPIFITLTVTASTLDTMICFGESTTICASPNIPGSSYEWCISDPASPGTCLPPPVGISTPLNPCTDVYPANTTKFLITVSDLPSYCRRFGDKAALSTNQDWVNIVVVNPKIDVGPDTSVCTYSELQMNANLLNPQPELTYKWNWSPGKFLSDSTIVNPILKFPIGTPADSIPDSITFYFKVTPYPDTTCFRLDTVVVHIVKGFYILTGDTLDTYTGLGHLGRQKGVSDTAICEGQSISLLGWGDPRLEYVWTPAAGASTPNAFSSGMTLTPPAGSTGVFTFSLTAQRKGCPDSTKNVNILVEPNPVVDIGDDRNICFGDTINLYALITPDPETFTQYKYKWTPGGALARSDTFFTYFTGYITSTVKLSVTTPAGCEGHDDAVFLVTPRKFLTPGPDTSICPGGIANISVSGDDQLKSVTWKPLTDIDSIHSLTPKVSPQFTTNFVVIGLDSNQCIDSTSVKVTVLPRAVIYLPDTAVIYPGQVYQIDPQGNSLYYTWFPPVGLDFPNVANPKANPLLNTTYYVKGVTDAGCVANDSIYIFVADDSYIDIPNAFIPGSNLNGTFKPLHLGDATLKSFSVYNRWGTKLFESTDFNKGWDGTYAGQPQPLGVYVYVLEAVTANGRAIIKQGNVTLIR